ncbi:FecCD family ABC transporter permease [Natronobeatus ordinarius]|uniref:FecCD family ABC transporter permease n=1 Tax=Natronobeatus ordinarius TaxID=2963433 RepID=UPI0020CD77E4|nr:iron ABC transporter permease [Natronobeatus ordinarius]
MTVRTDESRPARKGVHSGDDGLEGDRAAYVDSVRRKLLVIGLLAGSLTVVGTVSLTIGAATVDHWDVVGLFLSVYTSAYAPGETATMIILELRLPRVLMAMVAGGGLALAGVLLQALLKNPLASPYTLGIGSGAGFGASLAIVLGVGVTGASVVPGRWMVALNAFVFSLVPAIAILALVRLKNASSATMILAGIAMSYFFSASTSLLQYLGSDEEVASVVYWMFGSLSRASWDNLPIVAMTTIPLAIVALRWSWDFNALLQGEDVATSLGVQVERIRELGMIVASLITGVTVAFLGTIGFVGLVAPHLARMILGSDHRYLIPAAVLLGAILLVSADAVGRLVIAPEVLPVGIVTSFVGVPLFLYLILSRQREYW